ncbi:MAG: SRPBCC family protein [Cytophagales bacterium]|nr:SRPBCC family protein [Cytophagales bacterium]
MKILKIILIVLAIVVAVPLLAALVLKKEYAVERKVVISKPKAEVFDYLKYLKNQDNYSKWATMDPDMKKEYRGTDGEPGFVSGWESQNPDVGKGEQEIKEVVEGERVNFELRFYEPFEATDNAYMTTTSTSESETEVAWGFDGKMPYPMNLMLLFMDMEGMIGADLETGLGRLKTILESQPSITEPAEAETTEADSSQVVVEG